METPLFVFAHGAGAPSSHPWMQRWLGRLATIGTVTPFDYPYIKNSRKVPDRLPKLVADHREALNQARERTQRANRSNRKKPWGTGRMSLGIGRKGYCGHLSWLPIVWRR